MQRRATKIYLIVNCSGKIELYQTPFSTLAFGFVAVPKNDCPCTYNDTSGCRTLRKCSYSMKRNDLCEANGELPDGNKNYDVNNCVFGKFFAKYDVFRYIGGKFSSFFYNTLNNKQYKRPLV